MHLCGIYYFRIFSAFRWGIARERKYMMNYNSGYYMKLDRNTELARAINVMMAQVKRIYILL